jgi:anti-sigma factor RsiW
MIRRLIAKRRYMREHRWTHAHLSEYVDDELGPGEVSRVEAHVGICPHCRGVVARVGRTLAGLRSLGEDAGPGVADTVIDRLRHEP